MKKTHELIKEINDITFLIEGQYPELYRYLDENPVAIPNIAHPTLDTKVFSEYLEALKTLLLHHIESHKNIER